MKNFSIPLGNIKGFSYVALVDTEHYSYSVDGMAYLYAVNVVRTAKDGNIKTKTCKVLVSPIEELKYGLSYAITLILEEYIEIIFNEDFKIKPNEYKIIL